MRAAALKREIDQYGVPFHGGTHATEAQIRRDLSHAENNDSLENLGRVMQLERDAGLMFEYQPCADRALERADLLKQRGKSWPARSASITT